MPEITKPFPTLTCQHVHLTLSQLAALKPWQQLAARNSNRPPRSLADFKRQYARIHAQHHGTTPH